MHYIRILSLMIFLSLSVIYFSCDILTSNSSDVNGKVFNYDHYPVSKVKVTAGGQSVITSEDGSFSIKGISFPYDLIITDTLRKIAAVFKGLSTDNINLPLDYNLYSNSSTYIRVKIPQSIIQSGSRGKIIFTDGDYLNFSSDISSYDTGAVININSNKSEFGKLIVLTYKKDSSGKIISYDNYGESPELQIFPGIVNKYQFDSLDLTLNPSEETVSGSFELPQGYNSGNSFFYLSFSGKNTFYPKSELTGIGSYIFNFLIPAGIPSGFNTMVYNDSYGGELGQSSEGFFVYPNAANRPEVKLAPAAISPQNNSTTVNNTTEFSYSAGTGSGIYIVRFYNRFRNVEYNIITSKTSVTMEGLQDLGFGNINNNDFYWSVIKIGYSDSMNDYVTNFFEKPAHFTSGSKTLNFTTAP